MIKAVLSSTDTHTMARRLTLLLSIGLAVVLAACGADDASSPTTAADPATTITTSSTVPDTTTTTDPPTPEPVAGDEDWIAVSDLDTTLLFVKPEGYVAIDLTAGDVEEIMGQLEDEGGVSMDDGLRAVVDAVLTEQTADFVYWAFDFSSGSADFVPNVNVIKLPAGPFDRVQVYQEVLPAQYAELGLEMISIEEIETPAGAGVMIITASPEGWVEYVSVQLLVPTDEWVYTITFSFEDAESVDVDLVMKTFESLTVS